MQKLANIHLLTIHGGSFKGSVGAMGTSLTGAVAGATAGAKLLPVVIPYLNLQSQSYVAAAKTALTDFYLWNKYGHLGITSKAEALGATGGAFVGSIVGSAVFGMIMV
jgi:hypothetical protein